MADIKRDTFSLFALVFHYFRYCLRVSRNFPARARRTVSLQRKSAAARFKGPGGPGVKWSPRCRNYRGNETTLVNNVTTNNSTQKPDCGEKSERNRERERLHCTARID